MHRESKNRDEAAAEPGSREAGVPVIARTRMMTEADLDDSGTFVIDPIQVASEDDASSEHLMSPDRDALSTVAEDSRCGFIPGYSILGSLGQGGMGVVYQAIQERLQRVVALKVLRHQHQGNSEFIERFKREAMAVARLNHPNIVTAYDYGEADGCFYLAIEYVEGRDGAELISAKGHLTEREALALTRDAVLGLSHALSHGIIHRDVKPANLMLTSQAAQDASGGALSGRLKVTDLGLAQIREGARSEDHDKDCDAGKIVGTPSYMAPEQARGEDVDFRADIYALGATLYHFLTGNKPFDADTAYEILGLKAESRLTHPQDLVESISDDTVLVLDRMMAQDADDRYQSYEALLLDLIALLAGRRPEAMPLPNRKSSLDRPRIRRSLLVRKHRAEAATPLAFRLRLVATPEDRRTRMVKRMVGYALALAAGFGLAWLFIG